MLSKAPSVSTDAFGGYSVAITCPVLYPANCHRADSTGGVSRGLPCVTVLLLQWGLLLLRSKGSRTRSEWIGLATQVPQTLVMVIGCT